MAIILALLGMDYSRVLEPDGQRDLVPPPPGALELVKKEVAICAGCGRNGERLIWIRFWYSPYYRRERRVYYDTDDILEHRVDQIKRCNKCSGYRVIYSRAQKRVAREISVAVVHCPGTFVLTAGRRRKPTNACIPTVGWTGFTCKMWRRMSFWRSNEEV